MHSSAKDLSSLEDPLALKQFISPPDPGSYSDKSGLSSSQAPSLFRSLYNLIFKDYKFDVSSSNSTTHDNNDLTDQHVNNHISSE